MKSWELISLVLSALVAGLFHGPWIALSRSLKTFPPEVFLAIVDRMNRNMAPIMTVLMPAAMLSMITVLLFAYPKQPKAFALYAAALGLFLMALPVTMIVEVPIVEKIVTWTPSTLPPDWKSLRDRWMSFHKIRVVTGLLSFLLVAVAVIF